MADARFRTANFSPAQDAENFRAERIAPTPQPGNPRATTPTGIYDSSMRPMISAAEHVHLVEFDAEILADRLSAGENRDVFKHGLAAITEAWCFHRCNLEATAQLVDDERSQSLALNVLGDDDERLRGLHHRLKQRQQFLQARELLIVDQEIGSSISTRIFSALVMK
jgi:hypothetical protein